MTHGSDDEVRRWLEAERDGRDDEAEARFSALLSGALPPLDPSAAFADRVVEAAAVRARHHLGAPWRVLGAAAVLLVGLLLPAAFTIDPFAVLSGTVGAGAGWVAGAAALLDAWLAAGLTAWSLAASLGRAALLASSSGLVPFVLAANIVLALVSSCVLRTLMAPGEEYS